MSEVVPTSASNEEPDRSVGRSPAVDAGVQLSPAAYLEERLGQYQNWYDHKAIQMKALHLRLRTTSVICGALVPTLVNIELPYLNILTTALSLLVVILVSLESVYHYREQWKNYRSTEQLLGHERVYYQTRCGVYEGLDDRAAFRRLVERVEGAVAAENASTLSTMTLASPTTPEPAPASGLQ